MKNTSLLEMIYIAFLSSR